MPVKIPNNLPARSILEREGVMLMTESEAIRQDIRPLQIALLNLMPDKVRTETQFARLCGATPLQVEMTLIKMTHHESRNTPQEHLLAFYENFQDVRERKFDGLIITGAPVELLEFQEVDYWDELQEIFEWLKGHVHSTFTICWGAQAALYHFHGVRKYPLKKKAFGVFPHENLMPASGFLRGFSDEFFIPVSRWTEVRKSEIPLNHGLEILISSDETGPCLINDSPNRILYMLNHLEYDSDTLAKEYFRDSDSGKEIIMPCNYFPEDNPDKAPKNRWRSHAHLLFGNWINEIYQKTPFNPEEIGSGVGPATKQAL
jgi:homoserine O-succinyltransferase